MTCTHAPNHVLIHTERIREACNSAIVQLQRLQPRFTAIEAAYAPLRKLALETDALGGGMRTAHYMAYLRATDTLPQFVVKTIPVSRIGLPAWLSPEEKRAKRTIEKVAEDHPKPPELESWFFAELSPRTMKSYDVDVTRDVAPFQLAQGEALVSYDLAARLASYANGSYEAGGAK